METKRITYGYWGRVITVEVTPEEAMELYLFYQPAINTGAAAWINNSTEPLTDLTEFKRQAYIPRNQRQPL